MKTLPLEEVLKYKHKYLVERFSEAFDVSEKDSENVYQEMLKLLWLMATCMEEFGSGAITSPQKIIIYRPMTVIDEMWHNFVLFTQDYMKFCETYFGRFVHHVPTTSRDRDTSQREAKEDPAEFEKRLNNEIDVQCRYVAKKLGIETLKTWYKEFPGKFPTFTDSEHKHLA